MTAADRATRTASADELTRQAYAAAGGPDAGTALVAVGGYGRGELAPHSDLDLVLVHDGSGEPGEWASQLWYPLWDSGLRIDHSVRSLTEVVDAAGDLRVALGLLDARHLAGDPHLTLRLRTTMQADWRRQARTRLVELRDSVERRHRLVGELAHASVPDLKESEGGLRDVCVLKALQASWLVDASVRELLPTHRDLLDVRDALHEVTGRATDRVGPEHWADLALALGLADDAAAQRHVRSLGRRLAHLAHVTWHRVDAVLERPRGERGRRTPDLRPVAHGLAISRGEVVLTRTARPHEEPELLLRAAAAAAERGLVLAPTSVARLVQQCPDLPVPWPPSARDALVRLLSAGDGLLPVWETLEEIGAVDRFLPEWERVRLLPHASPIHRFTVDRHLVETCREAGALIRDVARPDLLLVAALLHDIGKGEEGHDHSAAGEPLARSVARRMGFGDADADRIGSLVRSHLVLAQLATTRDPDDPATVGQLLEYVQDVGMLALLRALTEADSRAAGPAAWTPWRQRLVDRLVARARACLGEASLPECVTPTPTIALRPVPGDWALDVDADDGATATLTVVAPEQPGLLAHVASVLCELRVGVLAARAWLEEDAGAEWGCSTWQVPAPAPDLVLLRERLRVADPTTSRCACATPRSNEVLPPVVEVFHDDSSRACVLQVRMDDAPGSVHRVLTAVAELDLTVASAHVTTVGPQAVDVFYVQEPGGVRPSEERSAAAAHAVRLALGG